MLRLLLQPIRPWLREIQLAFNTWESRQKPITDLGQAEVLRRRWRIEGRL